MARIDNLLDSGQGGLGSLVFYKMNGKNYVRTKPAHYRDAKSPRQLAQRQRLRAVTGFLRRFKDLIRLTFATEAVGRSALQAAQSVNMRNALTGEYPNIGIDKSKALLSKGPLPLPLSVSVKVQQGELLIEWENGEEASGSHAYDTLMVMALTDDSAIGEYRFTDIRRSERQYIWKTARPVSDDNLPDVWIAFRNSQATEMSDSMYITRNQA